MTPFYLTAHAVARYQRRHAPDSSAEEVRRYLAWALPHSERLGCTAMDGELRRLACGAVVVTKPLADGAVVVTALPRPVPKERPAPEPVAHVRSVARRVLGGHGFEWWRQACG